MTNNNDPRKWLAAFILLAWATILIFLILNLPKANGF